MQCFKNILHRRTPEWKSVVQYSVPVSNTRPIRGVKDGKCLFKASTKGKWRHCTPSINCIILKKIFLSTGIYSQTEVYQATGDLIPFMFEVIRTVSRLLWARRASSKWIWSDRSTLIPIQFLQLCFILTYSIMKNTSQHKSCISQYISWNKC